MFQIWAKTIQYKWDNNIESIPRTPIWNYYTNNSNNLRLYQKRFSERGCIYIKDIMNYDTNKFYDYEEFQNQFNIQINFLDYMSLIHLIPTQWVDALHDLDLNAIDNTK